MKTINFTPKSKTVLLGLSLVISFLLPPFLSNSQSVAIKDSKFEKALVDLKLDKDGLNGSVRLSDVDTVTRLMITNKGITDLTGIEAFKGLAYLNCDSNKISFARFVNLPNLIGINCANNKLIGLDFSHNKGLKSLDCSNNSLKSLNICNDSTSKINYLNTKGNPDLYRICVDDRTFATSTFSNIDLGVVFNDIDCKTGLIPDINFETALTTQNVDNNGITGTISLIDTIGIYTLKLKNAGINDLKGIEYFINLRNLDCSGNYLKGLDITSLQDMTQLNCSNNKISSLDISLNEGLRSVTCSFNDMTTLLIGTNVGLSYIDCEYNKLGAIDLGKFFSLDTLICENNLISSLNFNTQTNVSYLNIASNKLTSLNLLSMNKLTDLICHNNNLSTLILTGASSLVSLYCYNNNLSVLNVNSNPQLNFLYCDFNNITSLDISNNPKISELNCKYNNLTKLNIKNGNNKNMTTCISYYNDNLKEICTDDANFAKKSFPQKPSGAIYLDGNCINTSSISYVYFDKGKIYPNPFKGSFFLESNDKIESIFVTTLLGQEIAFSTFKYMDKTEIFIETPGVYILSYQTGNKSFQSKVISY